MIVIIENDLLFVKNIKAKLNRAWINDIKIFNSIQSYTHVEADLYLVDIKLEKNSYWLISEIREKTEWIICVVSSYSEKECVKSCFESWADFFINKLTNPFLYQYKILWLYKMIKRFKNNK